MATDERRALLEHFPVHERSHLTNLFLFAVREGTATVEATIDQVRRECHRYAYNGRRWHRPDQTEKFERVLAIFDENPDQTAAFAAWALEWVALPAEERERRQAEKSAPHKQAWQAQQAPTDRQLRYLDRLGHRGPVRSRAHASELIDQLQPRPEPAVKIPRRNPR